MSARVEKGDRLARTSTSERPLSRSRSKSKSLRAITKSEKTIKRSKSRRKSRHDFETEDEWLKYEKRRRRRKKKENEEKVKRAEVEDSKRYKKQKANKSSSNEENERDRQNNSLRRSKSRDKKRRSSHLEKNPSGRKLYDEDNDEDDEHKETDQILKNKQTEKSSSPDLSSSEGNSNLHSLSRVFSQTAMWCCESRAMRPIADIFNIGLRPLDTKINWKALKDAFKERTNVQVSVYCTDELAEDALIFHPVVRVSFVDATTGKYLQKDDVQVPAVSYHERASLIKISQKSKPIENTIKLGEKTQKMSSRMQKIKDVTYRSVPCRRITSQITGPCDVGKGPVHVVAPTWENQQPLVFNVPLEHILNPHVLIFFEILDFGSTIPYKLLSNGKGFYRVAWAFLRAVSKTGRPNIPLEISKTTSKTKNPRIRLQLYNYASLGPISKAYLERDSSGEYGQFPDVFESFRAKKRTRYPSTIYVNICGIPEAKEAIKTSRATLPCEIERGDINIHQLLETMSSKVQTNLGASAISDAGATKCVARRHRKKKEPCFVPTILSNRISVGKTGCFSLKFSCEGEFIAAACANDVSFPVNIYDVVTGKLLYSLEGHSSIVYEIHWRPVNTFGNDEFDVLELATASGDGSVRIWSIPKHNRRTWAQFSPPVKSSSENEEKQVDKDTTRRALQKRKPSQAETHAGGFARLLHKLQHNPPTYVYTVQYHPNAIDPTVLVTGAFDNAVRLWTSDGVLLGRLDRGRPHHRSRVNAATFSNDGNRLFTGDGNGVVNVWRLETGRRPSNPNAWHLARMIDDPDLRGNPINSISIHPTERLLLVSSHQHVIRLFELRRYNRVHNGYIGAPVSRSNVKCTFSPDGKYVLSGGEDGKPHFWDTMTTLTVPDKVWQLGYGKPLCAVAWHPNQHLVAFGCFGGNYPILMYEGLRQSRTTALFGADEETDIQSEALFLENQRKRKENIKKNQQLKADNIMQRLKNMDAVDRDDSVRELEKTKVPTRTHKLKTLENLDMLSSDSSSDDDEEEQEIEQKDDYNSVKSDNSQQR